MTKSFIHPNIHQFNVEHPDALPKLADFLGGQLEQAYEVAKANLLEGVSFQFTLRVWIEPGYYTDANVVVQADILDTANGVISEEGDTHLAVTAIWAYPFDTISRIVMEGTLSGNIDIFTTITAMFSPVVSAIVNCLSANLDL